MLVFMNVNVSVTYMDVCTLMWAYTHTPSDLVMSGEAVSFLAHMAAVRHKDGLCALGTLLSLYTRFVKQHTEQRRSEEQQGKFPVEGSNTYKHTSPHEHDGHSGGATTHCAIQMTATKERQYYKPERKLQWKCCSSCFNHLGFFFLFSCYHINIVFLQHADRCTEHRGSDNTTPTWLLTQNAGWGSVFKIFYKTW